MSFIKNLDLFQVSPLVVAWHVESDFSTKCNVEVETRDDSWFSNWTRISPPVRLLKIVDGIATNAVEGPATAGDLKGRLLPPGCYGCQIQSDTLFHVRVRMGLNNGPSTSWLSLRITEKLIAEVVNRDTTRKMDQECADKRSEQRRRIDEKLDGLVGLFEVKKWCQSKRDQCKVAEQEGARLEISSHSMNIKLSGGAGTGKSSLAKLLVEFLHAYGFLECDNFKSYSGSDLKAGYVGHTGKQVAKLFEECNGGGILIDEVSSVGDDSFTGEAIKAVIAALDKHASSMCCVIADYTDRMAEVCAKDSGFTSRFQTEFKLPDYNPTEIVQMIQNLAKRDGYELEASLQHLLSNRIRDDAEIGGGRLAQRLYHGAVENLRSRYLAMNHTSNVTIASGALSASDFGLASGYSNSGPPDEVKARRRIVDDKISNLVGMSSVKKFFDTIRGEVKYNARFGKAIRPGDFNMAIVGNAGTGKSTFGELLAEFLFAYGILRDKLVISSTGAQLKGAHVGQTTRSINNVFDSSRGGCLFLDEFSGLVNNDAFTAEAVKQMIFRMNTCHGTTVVIIADYKSKLDEALRYDDGLVRRFLRQVELENFTADELVTIMASFGLAQGFILESGLRAILVNLLRSRFKQQMTLGNAGFAKNMMTDAIRNLKLRVVSTVDDTASSDEAENPFHHTIIAKDFDLTEDEIMSLSTASDNDNEIISTIVDDPSLAEHLAKEETTFFTHRDRWLNLHHVFFSGVVLLFATLTNPESKHSLLFEALFDAVCVCITINVAVKWYINWKALEKIQIKKEVASSIDQQQLAIIQFGVHVGYIYMACLLFVLCHAFQYGRTPFVRGNIHWVLDVFPCTLLVYLVWILVIMSLSLQANSNFSRISGRIVKYFMYDTAE